MKGRVGIDDLKELASIQEVDETILGKLLNAASLIKICLENELVVSARPNNNSSNL